MPFLLGTSLFLENTEKSRLKLSRTACGVRGTKCFWRYVLARGRVNPSHQSALMMSAMGMETAYSRSVKRTTAMLTRKGMQLPIYPQA